MRLSCGARAACPWSRQLADAQRLELLRELYEDTAFLHGHCIDVCMAGFAILHNHCVCGFDGHLNWGARGNATLATEVVVPWT